MASGNTLVCLFPNDNEPPASNFATFDTRNAHPVLDFDAGTDETAQFTAIMPSNYAGGGVTVVLQWAASTATTGNVVWAVSFEDIGDETQNIGSDGFASAQSVTAAAPGTSGLVQYSSVAFTNGAQMDSVVAGDLFRIRVVRDADNVNDTMTGDAELVGLEIREI